MGVFFLFFFIFKKYPGGKIGQTKTIFERRVMKTVQEHAKYYKKNKKKEVSKNILVVANLLQEFQSELNEEVASFPDLNEASRLVISAKFVDAIKNLDKKWQELAALTGELNPHLYRVFIANASPRTFAVIWELRDIHFWGLYTEEKHKRS